MPPTTRGYKCPTIPCKCVYRLLSHGRIPLHSRLLNLTRASFGSDMFGIWEMDALNATNLSESRRIYCRLKTAKWKLVQWFFLLNCGSNCRSCHWVCDCNWSPLLPSVAYSPTSEWKKWWRYATSDQGTHKGWTHGRFSNPVPKFPDV